MPTNTQTQDNLKSVNALHTIPITIRNVEHFYKIVHWLNDNVGTGKQNWTFHGRVLRFLKRGDTVNTKIFIYNSEFDPSSGLYLSLI